MVEQAVKTDVPVQISAPGRVEPVQKVEVKPQIDGLVKKVEFTEGDNVNEQKVLFTLDSRPYREALAQAGAQLESAKVMARNAARELERGKALFARQMISAHDLDALTATSDNAEAVVKLRKAGKRTAALNLEYTTIKAPITGRTGKLLVFPGDVVTASTTPMVVINQITPVNAVFTLPEKDMDQVRTAMKAGTVAVSARIGDSYVNDGKLTFIDNEVDSRTGSVTMKALFQNTDEMLWPGRFVNVTISLGNEKDVVVIPNRAVVNGQDGQFAFVITDDHTASLRTLETGRLHDGNIVIKSGIQAGESVVTDGQIKITQGSKVIIRTGKNKKNEPAANGSAQKQ